MRRAKGVQAEHIRNFGPNQETKLASSCVDILNRHSDENPLLRMRLFSRRKLGREEVQTFYQEHGSALLLYACSLLGRKHAAEDVLHQVFMKLLEQNTMPEEPRPYLLRAVRNAALNVMRQESKDVDVTDIEPGSKLRHKTTLQTSL